MGKFTSTPEVNKVQISDEWGDEVQTTMKSENWLVRAEFAGCGKTTSILRLAKMHNMNILMITPYNKLSIELKKEGVESCTLAKVFGYNKIKGMVDVTKYDGVCFDEIGLYMHRTLLSIYRFMRQHPTIRFFATMDLDQINPCEVGLNNITHIKDYREKSINLLFPNQITLRHNKRLKTKEDQDKLRQMKEDILHTDMSVEEMCKKHGISTIYKYDDVKTSTNISFFNATRQRVNRLVREKIIKKPNEFLKGDRLVLKKRIDSNTFVNHIYKLKAITKLGFTVTDDEDEIPYPIKFLCHFDFDYCNTCHAVQGTSISNDYTIFDSNSPHADRFWLYTAVTRAREFKQLNVFIHPPNEVRQWEYKRVFQYLSLKVEGYKQQDKDAGREINKETFVDAPFILDLLKKHKSCDRCKEPYEFDNAYSSSNITLQRVENEDFHSKTNCILMCLGCNRTLSNNDLDMYKTF